MITRGDVQRVTDAFVIEETLYWWSHPIERVNTVQGVDAWDGYHWLIARTLAQDQDWVALKQYMDTLKETHLRETMEHLIQNESPRLYREYWTACPVTDDDSALPPDDPAFVKTGEGSWACWPKRPRLAINWDEANGINVWARKEPRVIIDVILDRGKDDSTAQ